MKWQGRSRKKETGGKRKVARKKRRYELGREKTIPVIGDERHKTVRIRGGNQRVRVMAASEANVTDPESNETERAEIQDVLENPANPHYVRRNILTKGAIVKTDKGKARITSRPGQDGCINAVLLK